jgi:hypothetical protein
VINKKIIILAIINFVLIATSGIDKGRSYFLTLPILLLIDIITLIYSIVKKDKWLIISSLILLILSPIIGFIIFSKAFPFLAR